MRGMVIDCRSLEYWMNWRILTIRREIGLKLRDASEILFRGTSIRESMVERDRFRMVSIHGTKDSDPVFIGISLKVCWYL